MATYWGGYDDKKIPYSGYSEIDFEILKTVPYCPHCDFTPTYKNNVYDIRSMNDWNVGFPDDITKHRGDITVACTNWDMACPEPENYGDGCKSITYNEEFLSHRWQKNYRALTQKSYQSDDELFGSPFYYFEIDWQPTQIIWRIFHGLDDILHLGRWGWSKVLPGKPDGTGELLDRANFLSQLGLIVATAPFAGVLYGVTKGRRKFNVARIPIDSPDLPQEFDGLRIVQISDMHLGSFGDDRSIVQNGVDLSNAETPDLVLFTGDMVNDYAAEAEPFTEVFASVKAKIGKYSILGTHDYSDYVKCESPDGKRANLEKLKRIHRDMGFKLLLDEHITLERGAARIGLLGVQNWGRRFQQYGKKKRRIQAYPTRLCESHSQAESSMTQTSSPDWQFDGTTQAAARQLFSVGGNGPDLRAYQHNLCG